MSEVMDHGIIGMPFDMAMASELSRRQFYSRAQAVLAELDQLRAEVERLQAMTAATCGVGDGSGKLFVHGDYDSIKRVQAIVFAAESRERQIDTLSEWYANSLNEAHALRGLLGECAEYLNTNNLTSIGHGSILHRKMIDAAMAAKEG